ncbi:MAG TPA: hypothetical protein VFB80_17710 [Pirellulaceae bacterium]|nr:hypothetical protein [Pirellulaceae bacterium]
MPIEFSCPACHQLVRTPDAAAGKKGKCPLCGAVVQIPAPAAAPVKPAPAKPAPPKPAAPKPAPKSAPVKPAPVPVPEPEPPAPEPAPDTIEFACVWCNELVRTPASAAGKRGKCPHCQRIVKIPTAERRLVKERDPLLSEELPPMEKVPHGAAPKAAAPKPKPAAKPSTPSVPAARPSVPPPPDLLVPVQPEPAKPAALQPAKPKPPPPEVAAAAGLAEIKVPDVTPITDPQPPPPDPFLGLTPLPSAAEPEGLTPLLDLPKDSFQTLTPLGPDNLTVLTPLPDDPLDGLEASGSPLGYGGPALAPRPTISDARRRGLPWEREPSLETFGETLKLAVGAPHEAFSSMRRSGGFGNPLGFMIVSYVVAQMLFLVEVFLFQLGWALLFQGSLRVSWEVFFIGFGISAVVYLAVALFLATFGGFVVAGFYHLGLLMFGGANAGFEATYRVVAFGTGSVYMLVPIPLVGPFFAVVMHFVVLIYGLMYAHQTTGGRAALAVFVPLFLATCCLCPVLLMMMPAVPMLLSPLGR